MLRNCPVKAIRVSLGHAEVVDERCIKDGRCVLVCPQDAKIQNDLPRVQELLREKTRSGQFSSFFVAAFSEVTEGQIVAALKTGFSSTRNSGRGRVGSQRACPALDEEKKYYF